MESEWVGSPNFMSGRGGRSIIAIVDHITQGLFPGCLEWMQNPRSKVSAHYLVTRTGGILQLIREGDSAYHAGVRQGVDWVLYDKTNPNYYTIGIEHEGISGEPLTENQFKASLWLHQYLIAKYPAITIDTDHILGHHRINTDHGGCPGTGFPWDRLFNGLRGGEDEMRLKRAVILFTKEDYWSGTDVAAVNGNCAIFIRPADHSVVPEAMDAEELIIIGGPTTGHSNEVLLSGKDKYETAAAVAKYLGGGS